MTGKIMPLRDRDTYTIQAAADAFLSSPRYANPNTRPGYTGVLDRLLAGLGASRPLAEVSGEELAGLLEQLWGQRVPATWNRNRGAVAAWLSWCAASRLPAPVLPASAERRREHFNATRAVPRPAIDRALTRRDVPQQAAAALADGAEGAAAARLPALQARIRVRLAVIHAEQGGPFEEAAAECQAATALLEAEGDLGGLAEAWQQTGTVRFWLGVSPAAGQALERAIAYARQAGHRRVEMWASSWLAATLAWGLPIPADAAIARASQLLQAAGGDPWAEADILTPLSRLYAYAGRFGDARDAIGRAQSVRDRFGAKARRATGASAAGQVELIAGDPAAAERHLRQAYQAYRAVGDRGYLSTVAGYLAEALYAQGRLDEARQMTEDAQAAAPPGDIDAQARWRAVRARILARGGQFPAARVLVDEAAAVVSPTSWAVLRAEILMARAEVDQLAGAPGQAEASLRAALGIYQDRHATPLAEQAAAALASLAGRPGARPA